MLSATTERRDRLEKNTEHFRSAMTEAGLPSALACTQSSPSCSARRGSRDHGRRHARARHLRHRIQLSGRTEGTGSDPRTAVGSHTPEHIDQAVAAFTTVGREPGCRKRSRRVFAGKVGSRNRFLTVPGQLEKVAVVGSWQHEPGRHPRHSVFAGVKQSDGSPSGPHHRGR